MLLLLPLRKTIARLLENSGFMEITWLPILSKLLFEKFLFETGKYILGY